MAYDTTLAARIRARLPQDGTTTEKAMFGGLAFLQGGAMFAGVIRDRLMVRTGLDGHAAALAEPHVRPMDFTGKALRGYVYVLQDGLATEAELDRWLAVGRATVDALAAKPARKPKVTKAPADQVWRDLGLAAPARRALVGAGLLTLDDVREATDAELRQLHGMGPRAIEAIRVALKLPMA